MRTLQSGSFCARAKQPEGRAIILLNNAPENSIPTTQALGPPIDDGSCKNDDLKLTVPYYPQMPPPPTTTYNLIISQRLNATGHKLFYMDGVSFQGNYNYPILREADLRNVSHYDPAWRVVDFGTNSSIRVNVWNNNTSPHVRSQYLLPPLCNPIPSLVETNADPCLANAPPRPRVLAPERRAGAMGR